MPALLNGLRSPRWPIREACVRALGDNRLAESEAPLLAALANDKDYRVRWWAVEALDRYKGPRVIRALMRALDDPTPAVQLTAAKRLGIRAAQMSRPQARRVESLLEARFREYGDGSRRPDAAYGWQVVGRALLSFGDSARAALEKMRSQRQDRWLAWAAYQVLYVPQSNRVMLCDEKEAVQTHERFAPPFPGRRRW